MMSILQNRLINSLKVFIKDYKLIDVKHDSGNETKRDEDLSDLATGKILNFFICS